jgi:hypothetical protein
MSHIRFLKVKIKSLVAESRIIRHEERCSGRELRDALRNHRVIDVRKESRAAHLAYGYLRGLSLTQVEPFAGTEPDWKRVESLVKKFGTYHQAEGLTQWQKAVSVVAQEAA